MVNISSSSLTFPCGCQRARDGVPVVGPRIGPTVENDMLGVLDVRRRAVLEGGRARRGRGPVRPGGNAFVHGEKTRPARARRRWSRPPFRATPPPGGAVGLPPRTRSLSDPANPTVGTAPG